MKTLLDRYLDRVLVYANKPESETEAIRRELQDHLLQKIDDLAVAGLSRDEATLEALRQHGSPKVVGYGLRGPFPWIDIRSHGTARGFIAIGPKAVGISACGGVAMGVFACGGAAIGIFSAGGLGLGLLFVWAGLAIGGMASGGMALGLLAAGGLAIGLIAQGGLAVGAWIPKAGPHGMALSYYNDNNAPSFLLQLNHGFQFLWSMERYIPFLVPFYIAGVLALGYLQYRESKRVESPDDWLMQG